MAMPGMGGSSFKMADELKAAVNEAKGDDTRGIQIKLDTKALRCDLGLKVTGSMEEAFAALVDTFEDDVPCLLLFKDDSKGGAWSVCSWVPENVPIKPKMAVNSAHKSVKEAFASDLSLTKDYKMAERSEATYSAYIEATKELDEDTRRAAMTRQEIVAEESKVAVEEQRKSLEGKRIGMVGLGAVTCEAHESFDNAVMSVVRGRGGEAALVRVTGSDESHQLEGEELESISKPSDLGDKLDDDVPCYVLMNGEDSLLLISWKPDTAPVKPRMNVSTFKTDVSNKIKKLAGVDDIIDQEVSEKGELTDDLGKRQVESTVPQARPAAPPKKTGPSPGAFKLPGLS